MLGALGFAAVLTQPALAANPLDSTCTDAKLASSDICKDKTDQLFGPNSFWTRLINTMIFVVGAVAVLMIVVGGLRYVLSGGDASSTKSARDTILYSIIGVVIAIMAYAIVNFVVVRLV
jgi:hypothetical protein